MRTLLSLLVMVGVMWGWAAPAGAVPSQADKSVLGKPAIAVRYIVSGGIAGKVRYDVAVDSDRLPPEQLRKLAKLIEHSKFFELPAELPGSHVADGFYLSLAIEMDGRKHNVHGEIGSVPPELRPLTNWLEGKETERATPNAKREYVKKTIKVELKGRLVVIHGPVILETIPERAGLVQVVVNGEAFWLDMAGKDILLDHLDGKTVVVTGTLEQRPVLLPLGKMAQVVVVESIKEGAHVPRKDYINQTVQIEVLGRLEQVDRRGALHRWDDPRLHYGWIIRADGQEFPVEISPELAKTAHGLNGRLVVVTGVLEIRKHLISPLELKRRPTSWERDIRPSKVFEVDVEVIRATGLRAADAVPHLELFRHVVPADSDKAGAWMPEDRIFVDITGKLTTVRTPGKVIAIWPPANQHWQITVNGRTFALDLRANGELWRQGQALVGQDVEVTGHLDGERVIVTSIQEARDPKPVVRVTITGTLKKLPRHPLLDIGYPHDPLFRCPTPTIPVWRIVAKGRHFDLVLSTELEQRAELFADRLINLTGTFDGNVITVTGLEPADVMT